MYVQYVYEMEGTEEGTEEEGSKVVFQFADLLHG